MGATLSVSNVLERPKSTSSPVLSETCRTSAAVVVAGLHACISV